MTKNCKHCNTPFNTPQPQQVYCTRECSTQGESKRLRQARAAKPARSITCEQCGSTITTHHPTKRFCNRVCQITHRDRNHKNPNYTSTAITGADNERLAINHFHTLGWAVYQNTAQHGCDLIIERNLGYLRVEVKTATLLRSGRRIGIPSHNHLNSDILCIVSSNALRTIHTKDHTPFQP